MSAIAASRVRVLPGDTRNWAPADAACLAWSGSTMVPAPRKISGTSLGDPFDRVERHRCAQRQFDHRHAARDQCAGDRYGVLDVVDHDDGNDGDSVEQ